jgi:hypothetical protein
VALADRHEVVETAGQLPEQRDERRDRAAVFRKNWITSVQTTAFMPPNAV